MLNDFISSYSAQVTISQEVAKWLKKPAHGETFEISFFKQEYYYFWNESNKVACCKQKIKKI